MSERTAPFPDPEEALAELKGIQDDGGCGARTVAKFERARALIAHPHNDCRWQALIAVTEWIPTDPDPVWQVILTHGSSEDVDMRAGVGCVLLEHLLEQHFDTYFPKLQAALRSGNPCLADSFSKCWRLGQTDEQWKMTESLKHTVRKQARRAPQIGYVSLPEPWASMIRELEESVDQLAERPDDA